MNLRNTKHTAPLLFTVANEADTSTELKELVNILYHLRHHTINWEAVYGSPARLLKNIGRKKLMNSLTNTYK